MLNLKLFTQLQGKNTASLVMTQANPGLIDFYVIASTVNYSIITSGKCEGELGQKTMSFDVVLSSLTPLLDKGYDFHLKFNDGMLCFADAKETFTISPLCVEHVADYALNVVRKYLSLVDVINNVSAVGERGAELRNDIEKLESRISYQEAYADSPIPSENPWVEPTGQKTAVQLSRDKEELAKKKKELENITNKAGSMKQVDFSKLYRIVNIASRFNTTVSMCDDYAIVDLKNVYILQKADCGIRTVQGKLLQRLLLEARGMFFEQDGELFFVTSGGSGKDRSTTMVIVNPFLPNTTVDKSIVNKGTTQEKYTLNLKGLLKPVTALGSKFDVMEFDMGAGRLVMTNSQGEKFVHRFEIADAKTLELNKLMRGDKTVSVTMSCISVPKIVQKIMPAMQDNFTVYVKRNKIVFESNEMFVVFPR